MMEGHARAIESAEMAKQERTEVKAENDGSNQPARLPLEKRDVTAVLVKPASGMFAVNMERAINKSQRAQAASPIREITTMLDNFVKPISQALLAVTVLVCIVSGVSILVSIYNSMNERRRDIAVMRALGARRDVLMLIILLESLLISLIGGGLGWVAGHAIGVLASPIVEYRTGIQLGFLSSVTWPELVLIPGLVVLASISGLIPALDAYRTDVSRNLSS